MATTKTNTTLPGIIGQCYEDRRNGESGVLVSRDTKCKTMNYQRADGTEFVRSYSHFRSYMRKKAEASAEEIKEEAYAEAELTPIEVSDEDAVKMEKNAKRKAKAKEKSESKEKSEPKERQELLGSIRNDVFESALKEFSSAVDSLPDGAIRLTADLKKKVIKFSLYNKKQFDLYVHARKGISKFIVQCDKFLSSITPIALNVYEVKPESGRKTNVGNYIVSISNSNITEIAEIIREYFVTTISETNKSKVESED